MSEPRPKRDCAQLGVLSLILIEVCFSLINSLAVNKGRDNLIAESLLRLLLLKVIYTWLYNKKPKPITGLDKK
jgi:hypothetical protein